MPGSLNVYSNVEPSPIRPESQIGESVGSSQEAPHSVVVCGKPAPSESQTTVSPTLIVVSQALPWNVSSQNQMSPT